MDKTIDNGVSINRRISAIENRLNSAEDEQVFISISNAILLAFVRMQGRTPIDTGNLRYNALQMSILQDKTEIFIDEKIAPYMKYTNENWNNFRPPLYGRQNPNEGWWDRAAHDAVYVLANMLGGTVTEV